MSVYVDDMHDVISRIQMCHMVADTTEELLAMVDQIGVPRKWIQCACLPNEHFKITKSKRDLAVKAGAIEVGKAGLVEFIKGKRGAA